MLWRCDLYAHPVNNMTAAATPTPQLVNRVGACSHLYHTAARGPQTAATASTPPRACTHFAPHAGAGSSEFGSSESNSQPPSSSRTPSLGALHTAPGAHEHHPPILMTETSTESVDPLGVEDLEDTRARSMRASWPQLQEMGRLMEQLRPRKVRSRSGHAMVSWQARTGGGKEVQVQIQDPGELLEEFERDREREGGTVDADELGTPWASMPPDWSIQQLARQLQAKSGLRLFNLDVICPEGQAGQQNIEYRVVDINYFPGFDKLPQFEAKFVDFLVASGREAASASRGGH